MIKKIICTCTILCILSVFCISAFSETFDNPNYLFFTGSDYDGVSAPALTPDGSLSGKYIISYSGWSPPNPSAYCDSTYVALPAGVDHLTYVDLGSADSFRLTWSGGQASARVVRYSLVNPQSITIDTTSSVGLFNSPGRYGVAYTNVPIYDSNGNVIFSPEEEDSFKLDTFIDDTGTIHASTYPTNGITTGKTYHVDYYLIPSSYGTPNYVQNFYDFSVTIPNFSHFPSYEEYMQTIGEHYASITDPESYYWYLKIKQGTTYSSTKTFDVTADTSFDINLYPHRNYGSGQIVSDNSTVVTSVDCNDLVQLSRTDSFYTSNDFALISVVSGDSKTWVCRFDFNALTVRKNARHTQYTPVQYEEPTPIDPPTSGQIQTLQDLAEYLSYTYNTTNNNTQQYIYNGIQNLDGADWSAIAPFFTTPITAGFAELSGEIDNLFDWAYVPSSVQMEEIQDDIDTAETEFRDKFSWVDDVKTEMYFVSTTIRTSGSDNPVFTAQLLMPNAPDNPSFSDYVSITLFDGSWVDSTTRHAVKDVITCFACLGLLIYVFKTLPSTVGNMPSD